MNENRTYDQTNQIYYHKIIDLWKKLCEGHSTLFEYTCDEYSLLLSSDIDNLEKKITQKEEVIERIAHFEKLRKKIIGDLNKNLPDEMKIESIDHLLTLMQSVEDERKDKHLKHLNDLLGDIIDKIQEQNRKNQIFINKAIQSLKEIKEKASGIKHFSTYTASGSNSNNRVLTSSD